MERDRRVVVQVDHDMCIGNAMCREAAPRAFGPSDSGQSVVTEPDAEPIEHLLDAAAMCPVGAILVQDAETGELLS